MLFGLACALYVSSGFTPDLNWCLFISQVFLRAFVLRSPLELNLMCLQEVTFLIPVPCRQPDPDVHYHQWSKVYIRGQSHHPIQWVAGCGWDHLRANPEFGVFWLIHLLLTGPISSQPTLKGGFSQALVQFRVVSLFWRLEGVRLWKLSRTYSGEKLLSLSVTTQGWCLATHKLHDTCCQYPSSKWDKCSLWMYNSLLSSACPGTTAPSFPRSLNINQY